MKKRIISLLLVLLMVSNIIFPILSFGNNEKVENNKNDNIKSTTTSIDLKKEEEQEDTDNYTEEYKEWLELPEEEREKYGVIPRKYKVPFSVLYDDEEEYKNTTFSNRLRKGFIAKAAQEEQIPEKFDLRDKINISIKDQNPYGLCWDFASIKSLETYLALNGYGDYDLSELHVDYLASEEFGNGAKLHNGRNFSDFEKYLVENYGPVLEEEVPYDANYSVDEYEYLLNLKPQVYVGETINFPSINKANHNNEYRPEELELFRKKVKEHIMKNGSLYCSICASETSTDGRYDGNTTMKLYNNNWVLNYQGQHPSNHAVSIIGWDDTFSKYNFPEECRPQNDGAYIAINSWGDIFFQCPIFYISYEDIYVENDINGIISASNNSEDILQQVCFEDINLYNEIKKILGRKVVKYDDDTLTLNVSKISLNSIRSLELENKNISNINGLENFKKLSNLNLSNNNIENIDCLINCKNEYLNIYLQNNLVKDISALKNFYNIDISKNPIELGLDKLENARYLILDNCNLSDSQLEQISRLPNLENLIISNNKIENVNCLKNSNINFLDLSGNKEINGIEELTNIKGVSLSNCLLENKDLTKIKNLKNLNSLDLSNNYLTDLSELNGFEISNLILSGNKGIQLNTVPTRINQDMSEEGEYYKSLYLDDCNIEDISPLTDTNINNISLRNNPITDISALRNNENVYSIDLSNTNVIDVGPLNKAITITLNGNKGLINLDNLENVNILNLNDCNISDFSFISSLSNLNDISLRNNDIIEIPSISSQSLWCIDISNNKLAKIPDLSNINLSSIDLSNNDIVDISNIENMINPRSNYCSINLTYNKIKQIPEIHNDKIRLNVKNNQLTDVPENFNGEFELNINSNYEIEINKDNRIPLHKIFAKENNNRYKKKIRFITENCVIDNKTGEIIIHPTELGEGEASVTIESDSWNCNSRGSKLLINYVSKENINLINLELMDENYKKVYLEGDNFDNSNLNVKANYENGLSYTITDYEMEEEQNLQLEQNLIKIKYEEKELEVPITVFSKDKYYDITFSKIIYDEIRELLSQDIVYTNENENQIRCIVKKEAIDNFSKLVFSNLETGNNAIKDFSGLSKLNNLKELEINNKRIENQEALFDEILKLKNIKIIKLNNCSYGGTGYLANENYIKEILKLPNLKLLDFGEKRISSDGNIEDKMFFLPKYLSINDIENIEIQTIYKNNNNEEMYKDLPIFVDKNDNLYILQNTKLPYEKIEEDNTVYYRGLVKINISTEKLKQQINSYYYWNPETEKPTVEITGEPLDTTGNNTNSDTVIYTFTWNEKVYGFTKDSITVENGKKGEFKEITPNQAYSLVVTNNIEEKQEATQKIIVDENVCEDLAGNGNVKAEKEIIINKKEQSETVNGDISGNGEIDPNDYIAILRHIAAQTDPTKQKWILSEEKQAIADVTKDGKIDLNDVIKIKRYIAAKNDTNVANAHPNWLNI